MNAVPTPASATPPPRRYQTGFGNEHASEALAGALPVGRNSPQRVPYGLYAEKFSATAFTAPRAQNVRSWFYRIRPSVVQGPFVLRSHPTAATAPLAEPSGPPDALRWSPFAIPETPTDFVDGWLTVAVAGDARLQMGGAVHVYRANRSMTDRYFGTADGELLIVPQQGRLTLHTECGVLDAAPGEIVLVPRGLKFRVELLDGPSRGYLCENYGALFRLPELGPIGSDCLANRRDFQAPVAAYEDRTGRFELAWKYGGQFYAAALDRSPLDVVAWHGTATPYKYDLARFNVIGSVSFDHPDPSIYTVLTSPSDSPGTANMDFVIFPPRWLVATDTFRPPWYHRNVMSEFMGLVHGVYDAKPGAGFAPGGASLHNCMTPHGPDAAAFARATARELTPEYLDNTMAFMFESRYAFQPTRRALDLLERQRDYHACWQSLTSQFDPASGTR